MHKLDLALNNQEMLISYKTQLNNLFESGGWLVD